MQGNLTRSKFNKGSVDGQFSHEILHRSARGGLCAGLCANRAAPFQLYQAAERLYSALRWLARVPQQQQDRPAGGSKKPTSSFVKRDTFESGNERRFMGVETDACRFFQPLAIPARGSASKEGFPRPCQKIVSRYCWRESLGGRLHGESERSGNDRKAPASGEREIHVESLCVMGRSPTH